MSDLSAALDNVKSYLQIFKPGIIISLYYRSSLIESEQMEEEIQKEQFLKGLLLFMLQISLYVFVWMFL